MDEKIRLKAVEEYCEIFALGIINSYFQKKDVITGPEILNLTEIRQVNLFVIRELMYTWKEETAKLRSPFFNYDAKEVTEALTTFQNTLSNHIAIRKEYFLPLLKKAAAQSLFVILAPYDFYAEMLDRHGDGSLEAAELRSDLKYLKINRAPMEHLVEKLDEKRLTVIQGNAAFALLDAILEEVNFTPEEIEPFIYQFSKVARLDLGKLFEHTTPEHASEVIKENVFPTPVQRPLPVANTPYAVKTAEAVPVKESPAIHKSSNGKSVLNQLQRIATIKENLTINQKFMFTKILFNGDFEIFSQAIDRLDALDNLKQAMQYLENNFAEWDKEGDEYLEFIDMLEKRYS